MDNGRPLFSSPSERETVKLILSAVMAHALISRPTFPLSPDIAVPQALGAAEMLIEAAEKAVP